MAIDKREVERTAKLARLGISPGQAESLKEDLSSILEHIETLKEADVEGIEPLYHILPIKNIYREDKVEPSNVIDEALRESQNARPPYFSVPKVF